MEKLFYLLYSLVTTDSNYSGSVENAFLEENAFFYSLLSMVFLSLIMSTIYYYILNTLNSKLNFNKFWNWVTILILNIIINAFILYSIVGSLVYVKGTDIESPGYVFIGLSCFYVTVFFWLWSIAIKGKSHAKFTPHIFPHNNKVRKK